MYNEYVKSCSHWCGRPTWWATHAVGDPRSGLGKNIKGDCHAPLAVTV
jgi:hypothetical protein